jgi:hypothetical protein
MVEESRQPQIAIAQALHLLQTFRGADLTQTIYQIEKSVKGVGAANYPAILEASRAKTEMLAAGLYESLATGHGATLASIRARRGVGGGSRTPHRPFEPCGFSHRLRLSPGE